MASACNEKGWTVNHDRREYGLQVILLKRTYVLPWTQFLYAEGTSDEVRAMFSMHDVVVTGCGLDALLADFMAQAVTVVRQPLRAEKFRAFQPADGPRVVEVEVRLVGENSPRE
jgi:hypothetical protein